MIKLARRYQDRFDIHKSKGIKKISSAFMLVLPHVITCLVLILIYPEKLLGIVIVGLILPDLSYFFQISLYTGKILNKNSGSVIEAEGRKKIAHIITAVVVIFLFFEGEYVISLAGGIHLVLDLVGF